ncbi:hypothetical protein, partial [Hungatella effluvii]|uniref:hypothetical protein n=1 Tax=Hungatella effluvii TaxID=1096246 RepID=UPI002A80B303
LHSCQSLQTKVRKNLDTTLRWVVIWYRRFAAFFDFIEISVLTVLCRNPLKRNGFKGFLF